MLVNGEPFTASTNIHDCLKQLWSSVGNCTILPEFKPSRFPYHTHIWRLLYNGFFCQGICCFLSGSFVLYTAGIFDSFSGITLLVALSDAPLIRCIFQRGSDPQPCFYIHNYLFTFSRTGANADIVHYMVSHGDFRMKFCIFGIDTTPNCNTDSNLEFILFIWKYLDRFDFIKYSITCASRVSISPRIIMS
jgi:hypothetical protein